MQLFAFGINHQNAHLDVREQVVISNEQMEQALRDLVDRRPVKEAAILSTCNRTEVYCNTDEPDAAIDWLANYHRLQAANLEPAGAEDARRVSIARGDFLTGVAAAADDGHAAGAVNAADPEWK